MTSKLIRNAILVARWGVVVGALVLVMILILTILADQVLSRILTREVVEQKLSEHSSSKSHFYMLEHDWRSMAKQPRQPIATVHIWDTNFYMLDRQYDVLDAPVTHDESSDEVIGEESEQ